MAYRLATAIEREMTIEATSAAPFCHPVLEETLRNALQECLSQTGQRLPHPPGADPRPDRGVPGVAGVGA